ncbi:ThuA domain-containing protein [Alkalicoccobacillus murimartini]|uniref:Type 1 glutamine amidotransferase n=1 Tax=Alkalicoccobacillus murimartini TaxID=171685 RepID=A0ABT9YEM8_9BACI|nr:ThuA domain-containing protein [Alkalicoccobacillus murimartini]MDQ0205996.1 type 1 glutamine amidotransferase [Alkalicoccobacillus murimartini]
MKKALIFQGGWPGHEPAEVAEILRGVLEEEQFIVTVTDTLETLEQEDLTTFDLIVPNWTQDSITQEQLQPLLKAVESGVGLAGLHGGMGDSFRQETEYQFMVGGQWVSHPGNDGVAYTVRIHDQHHPLTKDIPHFEVKSEQYYLHVDPAVTVHASTDFPLADGPHTPNGPVQMPVVWTKKWGKGNVYYCALGHVAEIVRIPEVTSLMRNGMVWAARAEQEDRKGGV